MEASVFEGKLKREIQNMGQLLWGVMVRAAKEIFSAFENSLALAFENVTLGMSVCGVRACVCVHVCVCVCVCSKNGAMAMELKRGFEMSPHHQDC